MSVFTRDAVNSTGVISYPRAYNVRAKRALQVSSGRQIYFVILYKISSYRRD